jgi:hypothetical protein
MEMIKNIFNVKSEKEKIEEYLAQSASLEDLERRQKELYRGDSPFQIKHYNWMRGIFHAY